jgi:hypothetical protein
MMVVEIRDHPEKEYVEKALYDALEGSKSYINTS